MEDTGYVGFYLTYLYLLVTAPISTASRSGLRQMNNSQRRKEILHEINSGRGFRLPASLWLLLSLIPVSLIELQPMHSSMMFWLILSSAIIFAFLYRPLAISLHEEFISNHIEDEGARLLVFADWMSLFPVFLLTAISPVWGIVGLLAHQFLLHSIINIVIDIMINGVRIKFGHEPIALGLIGDLSHLDKREKELFELCAQLQEEGRKGIVQGRGEDGKFVRVVGLFYGH